MMSEEKAKEDMLLWMDVETTGLDPDHDRILEVEMRCTDMRGVRCVGGFRRVIGLKGRKASITDGNLKAWRMHCANGLLEDALDGGYTEEATANALEIRRQPRAIVHPPSGRQQPAVRPRLHRPTLPEPPAALPPHRHGHPPRQSRSRRLGCETGRGDAGSQRPPHRHMPRPRHPPIRAHHPPPLRSSGPIRRHGSSKVMDISAVILLCAAILIGWMANRP